MFKKPARPVDRVFIHCTASDHEHHDNLATLFVWHVVERGWSDVGYHFVITKDGSINHARPINMRPAAQKGHNNGTIAICLTGDKKFSKAQFRSLRKLCRQIDDNYDDITFHGHREVSNKTCPNFDYKGCLNLDETGRMKRRVTLRDIWSIINRNFKKG